MHNKEQTTSTLSQFENINDNAYSFGSCDTCNANCCDGSKNIIHSPLTLEDFEEVVNFFPILFIYGELGYIRPVILLTNGKDFCKYIKDLKCSIYENRPSVCKVYPLSPHITDEIFIDITCPSVLKEEGFTTKNDKIFKTFNDDSFNNYSDKYINTHSYFSPFNKKENLEFVININGNKFYKFKEDNNQTYIKTHIKSLKHLKDEYFK